MSSSRRALLTSNIRLTDHDGKSLRLMSLAELFKGAGCNVTLVVAGNDSRAAMKYSLLESRTPLRDTLGEGLLKKMRHFVTQLIALLSFYAKLLICRGSYDIIVSSLAGFEIDSMLACMLSKVKRVPFIYDYDDPSPELRIAFYGCSANDPRVRLSRFTRDVLSRNADLVLTASDSVKAQIAQGVGNAKKVDVWYNLPRMDEVRTRVSKKHLREALGFESDCFVVCYLGRVPSWGIEPLAHVITDFAKDIRRSENILFLIIGGGRWEGHYRRIAQELGQADHVLITGMIPRQKALEYLMASDVSCIPFATSLASNHIVPTKLFEAMALGIPVLCSRSTNYVQILGDDGIYFNGSSHAITDKIRWCLMNKTELEKISSNLKSKFVNKYCWDRRSLRMEETLREIIQSRENNRRCASRSA